MIVQHLLQLWGTWGGPISAISGGAAGWYGRVTTTAIQRRRDRLDAGQQALQLVSSMQGNEERLSRTVALYASEIDQLRARRWAVDELFQELHGQAIAARMMVHELERAAGRPETLFPPLPAFPTAPEDTPAEGVKAGARAASTA